MSFRKFYKYFNLTKNETYFTLGFFVFIFSLLAFIFYGPNYNNTSESIEFDIPKGAAFSTVLDSLESKNIINSKFNMKVAAFLFGVERNIKAGHYKIPDGISYVGLISLLNKGEPQQQKLVTIQEGIWQKDLAELLEKELHIDKNKFMKLSKDKKFIKQLGLDVNNLEGYLLPETYYFYEGSSESAIIKKLVNEMKAIFDDNDIQRQMKEMKMDMSEILTMASIIDGESNKIEEFRRISGVYYNRIRNGWKLQADPTVQYLARQRRSKVNKVYYKDLEIDSKYNTYMYYGLPPTPINNPGKEAIMAAIFPEKHDLYFFVADGNGGHNFSKNSRDHENNVIRYRAWRRQNK